MFGATRAARGFRFVVWAPAAKSVTLLLKRDTQSPVTSYQLAVSSSRTETGRLKTGNRQLETANRQLETGNPQLETGNRQLETDHPQLAAGVWALVVEDAKAGDRYAYVLDGKDPLPDPASRFQPDGVHRWSEVVDPQAFAWTDEGWQGVEARRVVVYELHVGTFTPEGTFRAAIGKLSYLRELGVTAMELMPLADFAGGRNWGYDGVALFAPSRAYGRPDDLRALVDAAHQHGIAVIVDAVYNHLGPEGAYLPQFSPPFLTTAHHTPWGAAVNLDGPQSEYVRALLIDNALHWIREYHADGLRLDATHALIDSGTPHFVAELTAAVHAASGGRALVYAEDHRNLSTMVEEPATGGWGLDGVWADDFHHVVRRMLAGDTHGYYADFTGTAPELAEIFRHGWLYTGQHAPHLGARRGTDGSRVPLRKSVVCIQNHDQIGNRALGDRLHHAIDAARWRAATAILLTAPMTPLLFMGQEWMASTPFVFFTDFAPDLGARVVEGRRREFAAFPEFATPAAADRIPDPQAATTFEASKLRWDEARAQPFAGALALTRRLLALRAEHAALRGSDQPSCEVEVIDEHALAYVRRADGDGAFLVVIDFVGGRRLTPRGFAGGAWTPILHTEDPAFTEDAQSPCVKAAAGTIEFTRPGAMIFATTGTAVADAATSTGARARV